ncbi:MAG TPA: hypothetical protein P5117_08550 [Spirochaetia bacterium]|nr:hypothetical protein [Spirochaetales bacterium]HRY81020.1 hypothetical protein [Spirochaetia bacterium]HRZ89516.1 hypothetical protein [Spirochaetia bacterium]
MKAKYFTGIFLTLAVSAAIVLMSGGTLPTFVDVPTYLLLILVPATLAFASWPVREIGRAFSAPFDPAAARNDLEKSRLFFQDLRKWLYTAAGLGTMLGLVSILVFADGEHLDRLGRNLGVMLLCVTNAFLLALMVPLPLESIVRRRLAELA